MIQKSKQQWKELLALEILTLFHYMTHAENLFIDATFSVAPKAFYQCLVVIIFNKTLQIYIPSLYILMINKLQKMYRNDLERVFKLSRRQINPKTVTCDFELALINAIHGIFYLQKLMYVCLIGNK